MILKPYQVRVLDSLRAFFRECSADGRPDRAFQDVLTANERVIAPYVPVQAAGLSPGMPYVCVRVPTGGGKTLLACHSIGIIASELLRVDRSVVLWLVPSNTILTQTVYALRDPRHPYRRALELACGAVEVVAIDEALRLSRATAESATVVIVATIQSFRVEDTTGRRVYEQNGSLAEHFLNLTPEQITRLLPGADGQPKPSLVSVLRLRRPIVVVDEAHNARTDLSFATLGHTLPSCILEYTATPARTSTPSNVVHHVSAAELKAADMVKLPLRVITRHPSQRDQLLVEAITLRNDLERLAGAEGQATGEYIRPILLLQAERVDACEPLRSRLVEEFKIPADQIRISVGSLDELQADHNISSPSSAVRFVITVQKLREGWDCPFAYVLCSLKETRSAVAIEQIVGRILRLPKAVAKRNPDLNCSYVFSVSPSVADVLGELREALEGNGFTAAEAERIIIPVLPGTLPFGVQPQTVTVSPSDVDHAAATKVITALAGKADIDLGTGLVTVSVALTDQEKQMLTECVTTPDAKAQISSVVDLVAEWQRVFATAGPKPTPSPYALRRDFVVPLLAVQEGNASFEFESTVLLEQPWKLSKKDASLAPEYSPLVRPMGKEGLIDVSARGQIVTGILDDQAAGNFVATLHQQALALGGQQDWTVEELAAWLDRRIDHRDIPVSEAAAFLVKVIRGLMAQYSADIGLLALDRFRLRDEIEKRINQHRDEELERAFRSFLLPDSPLTVTDGCSINFKNMTYEPGWVYEGGYSFHKHYFGPKPGELKEKTPSGATTEEFKCAQFIDSLPAVGFWVRNLARRTTSFRLQTVSQWFYPDFVCQLRDGRVMAVEYKGAHLWAASEDKRAVGAVWASRSGGRCVFVMLSAGDFAEITAAVVGRA